MTTTRIYYEELLELFSKMTKIQSDEWRLFFDTKAEIFNLVTRIKNFNLIGLSFTSHFYDLISNDKSSDLINDKILLCNELRYELSECLWVTRLHYGGELGYYSYKINHALLNLSISELTALKMIIKTTQDSFLLPNLDFATVQQKDDQQHTFLIKQKKNSKKKAKPTSEQYKHIETIFNHKLELYKSYIFANYSFLADNFQFYNKRIQVYITDAISSDDYEIRIHTYPSPNGDGSITIEHKFYDFVPSYGFNLEEISEKPLSFYVTGYEYKNDNLESITESVFGQVAIHHELKNIYISNANNYEINELVRFFYNIKGFKLFSSSKSENLNLLTGWKGSDHYVLLVLHQYTSDLDSMDEYINRILAEEKKYLELKNWHKHYKLVVFSTRAEKTIEVLFQNNGFDIVYVNEIIEEQFKVDNSKVFSWYVKSMLATFKVNNKQIEALNKGEALIERLAKCETGEKHWSDYEDICIEIFEFLFSEHFVNYTYDIQVETQLKNHRRDLIVHNNFKHTTSFWSKIYTAYNARIITIEFKNYSDNIKANTVFNSTKYTKKQTGSAIILLSRKGVDEYSFQEIIELIRKDVLVISLNDSDIKDMIREKIVGKDCLYRLDFKMFEILKKI
ncbi:hypothetical protein LK994_06525 [Ferruginibacter lapsinanis]|uniref:hypothetical protein n=1 Tax=Ferruginibacter lapsinanis TaxID=563172 RepID=UPI001E5E42FF|nr:hypothetical protein [Ferruginibacter lapsinanis]UEG51127.1 hypothetical protein LK994_06525 [Ferruginibacter lapsinanis]